MHAENCTYLINILPLTNSLSAIVCDQAYKVKELSQRSSTMIIFSVEC